jgi:hypothetical protein
LGRGGADVVGDVDPRGNKERVGGGNTPEGRLKMVSSAPVSGQNCPITDGRFL